jgi:hypothetical protein
MTSVAELELQEAPRVADWEEQAVDPQRVQPVARTASGVRRVNVNFAESTYGILEELARKRGKSMAEVLRDAIALEKWIEDARAEGARFLIRQGNETRELVLR